MFKEYPFRLPSQSSESTEYWCLVAFLCLCQLFYTIGSLCWGSLWKISSGCVHLWSYPKSLLTWYKLLVGISSDLQLWCSWEQRWFRFWGQKVNIMVRPNAFFRWSHTDRRFAVKYHLKSMKKTMTSVIKFGILNTCLSLLCSKLLKPWLLVIEFSWQLVLVLKLTAVGILKTSPV